MNTFIYNFSEPYKVLQYVYDLHDLLGLPAQAYLLKLPHEDEVAEHLKKNN